MATSVTTISDRPALPAGSMILRSGKAASETVQEPGPIECPSDSAAMGGRPRNRTKLLWGTAFAGPTRTGKAAWLAASPAIAGGTAMDGCAPVCAWASDGVQAHTCIVARIRASDRGARSQR